MRIARIDFQEFVEERAIVDDGLTHLFGARLAPLASHGECASGAVVLNNHWMVDRYVVGAPVEVLERVTTRRHHLGDELIGFSNGAIGVVDETRLNATPFARERVGLVLTQLAKVETLDAFGAFLQDRVSACGADRGDGSLVLGSEALAQAYAAAPARVRPHCHPEQQNENGDTDEHQHV